MNDIPPSDSLLWEALPDLTLNIAQTAALCSISVRQLGYWTRQGYVTASGKGARRIYGLEAIRRVLAIRKAMEAGASLRQSLRQLSGEVSSKAPTPEASLISEAAGRTADTASPAQASALKHSLIEFFQVNCYTRDHAGGLAVKLGWAEEDVRVVAESLCASGILAHHVSQGLTIFRSTAWEEAHG